MTGKVKSSEGSQSKYGHLAGLWRAPPSWQARDSVEGFPTFP